MKTINISELRANLLKYLESVNAGEPLGITSNGRLLATLQPPVDNKEKAREQLQQLAVTAVIHDITSPIDSEWESMS